MAKSYSTFSDMAASNFASISGPTKSKTSGPDDGLRGGSSKAATSRGIMSFSSGGDDGGGSKTTTKQVVSQQRVNQGAVNLGTRVTGSKGLGSRSTAPDTEILVAGDPRLDASGFNDMWFSNIETEADRIAVQREQEEAAIEAARRSVLNNIDFPVDPRTNMPVGAFPKQSSATVASSIPTGFDIVQSLTSSPVPTPRPSGFPSLNIRLNNPGNIRRGPEWEGLSADQRHASFATFDSPVMGVRAMARNISTYNTRDNLDTIRGIVSKWAPPNENATNRYINFVSDRMGVGPDDPLNLLDNPQTTESLISAMIVKEGGPQAGVYYTPEIVSEGVRLGFEAATRPGVSTAPLEEYAGLNLRPADLVGEPEDYSVSHRYGPMTGQTYTYDLNGSQRQIIDVTETTAKEAPYRSTPRVPIEIEHVVFHETGGLYTQDIPLRQYLNSFNGQYDSGAYKGPSAAFYIDRDGNIYQTFDPEERGKHVTGDIANNPYLYITNSNSVGIEVEADPDNPPTQAQLDSGTWLADYIMANYGATNVLSHPMTQTNKQVVEGYANYNHWAESHGLAPREPSGESEESRRSVLLTDPANPPQRQAAPTSEQIRQVQAEVGAGVDGQLGPETERMMRAWLNNNNIRIPSNATRNALVNLVNRNIQE